MSPFDPWTDLKFSLYLANTQSQEKSSCATIYFRQRKYWEWHLLKTMVLIQGTSSLSNSSKPYSVAITTNNHWSRIPILITTIHTNNKSKQLLEITDPKKLINQNNSGTEKLLTKINFYSISSNFTVLFSTTITIWKSKIILCDIFQHKNYWPNLLKSMPIFFLL